MRRFSYPRDKVTELVVADPTELSSAVVHRPAAKSAGAAPGGVRAAVRGRESSPRAVGTRQMRIELAPAPQFSADVAASSSNLRFSHGRAETVLVKYLWDRGFVFYDADNERLRFSAAITLKRVDLAAVLVVIWR